MPLERTLQIPAAATRSRDTSSGTSVMRTTGRSGRRERIRSDRQSPVISGIMRPVTTRSNSPGFSAKTRGRAPHSPRLSRRNSYPSTSRTALPGFPGRRQQGESFLSSWVHSKSHRGALQAGANKGSCFGHSSPRLLAALLFSEPEGLLRPVIGTLEIVSGIGLTPVPVQVGEHSFRGGVFTPVPFAIGDLLEGTRPLCLLSGWCPNRSMPSVLPPFKLVFNYLRHWPPRPVVSDRIPAAGGLEHVHHVAAELIVP